MVIRANVDMFPYARKYADMFPCARKIVSMFFSQSGCACSVVCLCKSTTRATLYNRTDWHSFQGLNRCANCLTAHPRATPIVISRGFHRGFQKGFQIQNESCDCIKYLNLGEFLITVMSNIIYGMPGTGRKEQDHERKNQP
jgi:hypothetical protein